VSHQQTETHVSINLRSCPPLLALFGTLTLSLSCGKLEDTLLSDPQRSSCTAYCEWAVACHAEAREVDSEALLASCLSATQAQETQCKDAEESGINPVSSRLMKSCVEAIDAEASANSCAPFTGDAVQINTAFAPGSCVEQSLFNSARTATAETNDELCERVSDSLCEQTTSCLEDFFNVPQSVLNELMPPALDRCLTRFDEDVTSACRDEQLYALDQEVSAKADIDVESPPEVLFSVNANRESARACLAALATIPCDELFAGELPPICAGAFSDPTVAAGAVNGFACGLEREELAAICE